MQEEVTDRAVQVTIQTSKLTGRVLQSTLAQVLAHVKNKQLNPKIYKGRQSVKQLVRQGAGVSNIEVTDKNIKSFDRVARKYGVDYAIRKDSSTVPPKYMVFFKARDADALTAAFAEFTAKTVQRGQQKPSLLAQLQRFKKLAKGVIGKVHSRDKGEREL
ncbi:MAG: PcfB family protein [Oscillospiraceae bacterium]|nr:PcfB family protein [Oscillospiraceae bacterium]